MTKNGKLKDGPFYMSLERTLQELNVKRQAYHGGTFIGNHVHKLLKVRRLDFIYTIALNTCLSQSKSITAICNAIFKIAETHSTAIQKAAGDVVAKFQQVLKLFSKCHRGYNSSTYKSDEDIDKLGKHY